MLYVSTRSKADSFTAFRTLHEEFAPDGGMFVPFHLTHFPQEILSNLKDAKFGQIISGFFNYFFGLSVSQWEIECYLGKRPIHLQSLGQKIYLSEFWNNAPESFSQLEHTLCEVLNTSVTTPWVSIVIRAAVLASVSAEIQDRTGEIPDVAIDTKDFSTFLAALYVKKLGFPLGKIVCCLSEHSDLWNFICHGELSTASTLPKEMEHFIHFQLGAEESACYRKTVSAKSVYKIRNIQLSGLSQDIFPAVIGKGRESLLISQIFRTSQIQLDPLTAGCYGAVQDYRAKIGESHCTILLSTHPEKE